jgi:hypothetical protein
MDGRSKLLGETPEGFKNNMPEKMIEIDGKIYGVERQDNHIRLYEHIGYARGIRASFNQGIKNDLKSIDEELELYLTYNNTTYTELEMLIGIPISDEKIREEIQIGIEVIREEKESNNHITLYRTNITLTPE